VLVRNQRPAVGEELWEIPAGTLEPGETTEQAALRELAEETGYRAGNLVKLGEFFPSPGLLTERTHVYAASELVPGEQALEADETITPHVVPWSQAMAWVHDGTIRDAKTLIALMWFYSRRED
jgi:ADP-ribose pyrophosphatase